MFSEIEKELERFSRVAATEFRAAAEEMSRRLSRSELDAWAEAGLGLAGESFRSWEAAVEYFKASPRVRLDFSQLMAWAGWGKVLSHDSYAIAASYFEASPLTLGPLLPERIADWARLGQKLYQGTWRSRCLSSKFFEESPRLVRCLDAEELVQFVSFIEALARESHDFADECLGLGGRVLAGIETPSRKQFLALVSTIARSSPRDARDCFQVGRDALSRVEAGQRGKFLSLAYQISQLRPPTALDFFSDGSTALEQVEQSQHAQLLELSEKLLAESPAAAVDFLNSCPRVFAKIKSGDLSRWFEEGMDILRQSHDGGVAYFRLESSKGENMLSRLTPGVELCQVRDILGMYCMALSGKNVQVLPIEEGKSRGIGWSSPDSEEGTTVLLPPWVARYDAKDDNFSWYKVMVTHQAAHIEFGSFDFVFDTPSRLFSDRRPSLAKAGGDGALTDLGRFFNLFEDRHMASDIFTVVEDSRVDHITKHQYRGIRRALERIQRDELAQRRPLRSLPLKEALVEILVHISLDGADRILVPGAIRRQLEGMVAIARKLKSEEATVEDSAEATIRLYMILTNIPNLLMPPEFWDDAELLDLAGAEGLDLETLLQMALGAPQGLEFGEGDELSYSEAQEVEFRGDFKPELVQLIAKLKKTKAEKGAEAQKTPLSQELLKELMEQGDLELSDLLSDQLDQSSDTFISDIDGDIDPTKAKKTDEQGQGKARGERAEGDELDANEPLIFLYDEWDFRARDYKPNWCCLRERKMEEGSVDFHEETLQSNAPLANQVRRQFELLAPELFRKIKKLNDGQEYELDAVIEALVERKAGNTPSEKLYWRRNKVERDVCVAFLLDMSASTAEAIEETPKPADWDPPADPRGYRQFLADLRAGRLYDATKRAKRIIDVEKESIVLLMEAIKTIGDRYAIYGFSGYGRENVDFFVIKDIEEDFSDRVKKRVDRVAPLQATRMGPPIRHATYKLDQHDARTKVLFLISDGRPQDHDYGRDRTEKEYAIHDTHMALLEARRKNIVPFCLTVDKGGHDYLKAMCGDLGYEVVDNVESLPKRLPLLYRWLTV